MTYTVKRLLGEEYLKECQGIHMLRQQNAGTKPLPLEDFIALFEKYFVDNENYFAFGCFENDSLVSWIGLALMENKKRGRFYTITSLYTTKFRNYFKTENLEIEMLYRHASLLAESMGYYTYFYSISNRLSRVYERQEKRSKFYRGKYELYDLDVVPAGTVPETELYWKLMGQEIKPDDIIIKKRVLKEEFQVKKSGP